MDEEKIIPTGVKIYSILSYIGAFLSVIFGLLFVTILKSSLELYASETGESIPFLTPSLLNFFGFLMIIMGVFGFFIARGLWKGQNWAKIITIIFAILGFIQGLISLITGNIGALFILIIYSLISGYFIFNQKVKLFFSTKNI